VAVEEDEPNEVAPEGCSPEHGRQRRGDATEVKNGGSLSSARGKRKVRGSSRERERWAVKAGVFVAFYKGRGSAREGWPGQ
jgi:hypothetical protein